MASAETPFGKKLFKAAQEGFVQGVKGIPGALRSKNTFQPSPVSHYATNPFASPNMSVKKWQNNINRKFRREAGNTVRQLFANSNTKHNNNSPPKPRITLATPRVSATPFIPKPSPYLLSTPLNYRQILSPSNTTPREPELRGGYRKTRKHKKSKRLTRRFVKPKILRY